MMLVQGRPGAKVVPATICRDAVDMGSLLTFGRARLQHRVVDADVLALGIEPAKSDFEFCGSKRGSNFFQQRRGIGKTLSEVDSQGPRSPEKHPTVPKIISCFVNHVITAIVALLLQ